MKTIILVECLGGKSFDTAFAAVSLHDFTITLSAILSFSDKHARNAFHIEKETPAIGATNGIPHPTPLAVSKIKFERASDGL